MPYVVIDDFRLGMDRRKKRISGTPGALWTGVNGHINRGGAFEKRKKFVKKYTLPTDATKGLGQYQKQLFVWGNSAAPGTIPAGVNYQRIASPGAFDVDQVLDVTTFSGKFYTVARFRDGSIYHYYNGTRVAAWDAIAAGISGSTAVASFLAAQIDLDPRYNAGAIAGLITIQAALAGTAFTDTPTATGTGTLTKTAVQANVVMVPETLATCMVEILDGQHGVFFEVNLTTPTVILSDPTPWAGNREATALSLANNINTETGNSQFTASALDGVVTLRRVAGTGASGNSSGIQLVLQAEIGADIARPATVSVNGGVPIIGPLGTSPTTIIRNITPSFSGGVDESPAVAQVDTILVAGTYADANGYSINLDGTNYVTTGLAAGMGITSLTYQGKMYSVTTSLLEFSKLNDPTDYTGTGSGFINMTNQNDDNDALVGAKQYQDRIAVFSRSNIQIWVITVDPAKNTFQQSVENSGALSIRSIQQYGNIDVFYLNDSGVRSLRARDLSNSPAVNDVGVAIDPFIQEYLATLTGAQISRAPSVIEPLDGRYWLALHNRIFVYSLFPGSKISAWSYYDLVDEIGDVDITDMVKVGQKVYIRAGDSIYVYGGDNGATYPDKGKSVAVAALPFLSANKPATIKNIHAFDVGVTGLWEAQLLTRVDDESVVIEIGKFSKPTYTNMSDNPIQMPAPLFAVNMIAADAGPAVLSNMCVHFNIGEET